MIEPALCPPFATDPTSELELRGLARRFGTNSAVNDVSLRLAPGEITCLLGASGCGKSTLLRLIAGVEVPDAGEIVLGGRMLSGAGVFVEPEARRVGFMFQDYALFPHLSVAGNVAFGLRGQSRDMVRARVQEVLAVAGAGALADRYPHLLSGGESQRVALARALAPRPALLLMDEPFSNLDPALRETVRADTLGLLRSLGIGALIVTHDPVEALAAGDRVVLMRAGRIEAEGKPRALYAHPPTLFAARFLGPGTALPCTVAQGAVSTPLGRFDAPGLAQGAAAVLFFRPQALSILPAGEGVAARIVGREFLGGQERLSLMLGADGSVVQVLVPTEAAGVRQTDLGIRLDPAQALVFPAGPGGG